MLKAKFFIPFIACMLITPALVLAKTQQVEVHVSKITAQKTSGREGDHLYFSLTEYPTSGDAKVERVPQYPLHWLSKELPMIKDVVLWKGVLEDNNDILIVFSLMNQKFELLDADKLIGSIQVELTNKNNKIKQDWGLPHYYDEPMVEQPNPQESRFILFGDDSQYEVVFAVKTSS